MNQVFLKLALVFATVAGVAQAQAKPEIEFSRYSFYLSVIDIQAGRKIYCDSGDIVGDIVGAGRSIGLVPSLRPYHEESSWYVRSEECPTMAPEYNGAGILKFDQDSGRAIVYLTHFYTHPVDMRKLMKVDSNSKAYRDMIAKRSVTVSNLTKFGATCKFSNPLQARLKVVDPRLVCKLDGNRGSITLRAVKRHPGNP